MSFKLEKNLYPEMKSDHLFEEVQLKPANPMFSKFHSQHPQSVSPHPHPHPHPHQQNNNNHNNNSDDDGSPTSGGPPGGEGVDYGQSSGGTSGAIVLAKRIKTSEQAYSGGSAGGGGGGGGGDGASIEVSRRPRGRPPGSKNKPKPPIIITRDTECAMRPHILEISTGLDIIDGIARFARQRNVGLCVLTASGSIMNVSLRQPAPTPGSTVTFHGRFEILSISATFLPQATSASGALPPSNGCTISLAGPQGQIFGGAVVGALIAATNVFLVATSFMSPTYHRLPIEEEAQTTSDNMVGTSSAGGGVESHSTPSDSGANPMQQMYNCTHIPSEGIWTPTARPPSQHF